MKTITLKVGTRAEILDYLRKKIKGTYHSPFKLKDGDLYEHPDQKLESQINEVIREENAMISVSLRKCVGKDDSCTYGYYREQFIVSDFAEIKVEMDVERADKGFTISRMETLLRIERDAKKRHAAAKKLAKDFKGKTIKTKIVPIFADTV